MPIWHLEWEGTTAPDLGVKRECLVPWRPLGKSNLVRSPWCDDRGDDEDYLPTVMSVEAAKVGLEKAREPYNPFPEEHVLKAQKFLTDKLKAIWTDTPEDYVMSYDDAILELKHDKSPGFPYYYRFAKKGDVLDDEEASQLLKFKVEGLLAGDEIPCYFTLTEKSELRPREKVLANKTRIFFASDMHHLVASKMLFDVQNEQLMDKIGQHPITLGIQMPGPQYVSTLSRLVECNEGDLSGCDLRFNLRLARAIRDVRLSFLPTRYKLAVQHLYNTVYAGYTAGLGGLYRVFGNKSGWENTSHDNSFMVWLALLCASYSLYPDEDPDKIFTSLINGDDLVVKMFKGYFTQFRDYLLQYNTVIEAPNWEQRPVREITFLSHHLEQVYVSGFGQFTVAAGNLTKLLSSVNWIKKNANLTFEESCVAHLLGVRLCLFPWAVHFDMTDQILSDYLKKIEMTDFIRCALCARLTKLELAKLHTRVEGFFFPSTDFNRGLNLVLKGAHRQIKESLKLYYDQNKKPKGKGQAGPSHSCKSSS